MPETSILKIYKMLYKKLGPQDWWPGDTDFEVMIGAILTQNTAWTNVEKAIINIKKNKVLTPQKLSKVPIRKLCEMIRPSGFYNVKAKRIRDFLEFLKNECGYDIEKLKKQNTQVLRRKLLSVKGIGRETADSIILYALDKRIFVVDAYTRRIFSRHDVFNKDLDYDQVQNIFMKSLPEKTQVYNEYHALIVNVAKKFCRSKNTFCNECPLKNLIVVRNKFS